MRALLASPLGFLIGLSLGALGGGGSILAVPALVYGAGQGARPATASSLVLVAVTSLIGIIPHVRAGRVRFVSGTVFGLAGIGGSLVGSRGNAAIDPDALLLAFSAVMFLAAFAMWRRLRRAAHIAVLAAADAGGSQGDEPAGDPPQAGAPVVTAARGRFGAVTVAKVVLAGSGVGLLTGFFGVGGGFVIVPALVLTLGFAMPEAIGTSLLVITINSLIALSTRLQSGSIDWSVVIPFLVASLVGVIVGGRVAGRRDPAALQRWFVVLLVAVATYTAIRSALAL